MHDAIGGSRVGWMNRMLQRWTDLLGFTMPTSTAVWVIWQSAVNNTLPPDAQWNNQTFDFFDPTGAPKNYPVTDVLQTTWPLCDQYMRTQRIRWGQ
jgi:hypothetical protein